MATKTKRTTTKRASAPEPQAKPVAAEKKQRKPYPSREERVSMADKTIRRLTDLNARREKLIEKTEAKLAQRKADLAKSTAALDKALAKKARLENVQPKAVKKPGTRASKSAEKAKLEQLQSLLATSGKTLDDLITELKP